MKQIARVRLKSGKTVRIGVKEGADSFQGPGGRYLAPRQGEWGIEKTLLGPRLESLYLEGFPTAVGGRDTTVDVEVPNGHGNKTIVIPARVPDTEEFNAGDFETIYGEPIQMWLARAIQRAAGGNIIMIATLGVCVVNLLIVGWLGYHFYEHPWK